MRVVNQPWWNRIAWLIASLLLSLCAGGEVAARGGDDSASGHREVEPGSDQLAEGFTHVTAEEQRTGPETARWEMVESLRADLAATRHASDGGGRAWLVEELSTIPALRRSPGTWVIDYEAGPLGIAEDGAVYLQISPFWGWSTPQVRSPDGGGFTRVNTTAEGIELEARTIDRQLLVVFIRGRKLRAGERIRFEYGAREGRPDQGEPGMGVPGRGGMAMADRYAEHNSRFWIAVDGDGDGVRSVLPDSPGVEVVAGPPLRLQVTLPTVVRPGEIARMTLAFLDAAGNAGFPVQGEVTFLDPPAGLELPESVAFTQEDGGARTITFTAKEEGIYRLLALGPGGLTGVANPLAVTEVGPRVFWGDLQGHGNLSDGTGTPDDFHRYARDVAALDVVALTEHDHWGMLFLDSHPQMWDAIKRTVDEYHEPGRFVALLGYEWTNWVHGHRHVVYFGDTGDVLGSLDPDHDTPPELWAALQGRKVLTIAHHSLGDPVPVNWSFAPDPLLEPVTEIVSVHGSSEAMDTPGRVRGAIAGNSVRDQLDRGYKLGIIGSGDSHDGHPGLCHLAAGPGHGGVAAILAEDLTRDAVYEALRARRCYATSGPRILMRFTLDGHPMGATVPASANAVAKTFVLGTAPITEVALVRSGAVLEQERDSDRLTVFFSTELPDLRPGEYVYLRVIQEDGSAAWSSPFFVE